MVTIAEIKEAVGANPALLNEIASTYESDIMTSLRGKGIILRTAQEEESFLDSYLQKQDVKDKVVSPVVKEIHDKYDAQIFELTGETRKPNEKTYEFLTRKINELKTAKVSDPILKAQLERVQNELASAQQNHTSKIEELTKSFFSKEVKMDLSKALSAISINAPLHLKTDDERQRYIKMQKDMIESDFLKIHTPKKDNDGNIVYFKGETPQTSQQDGKPLSALDLIKANYSIYISPEQRRQTGAGGGGDDPNNFSKPSSKDELVNQLKASGLVYGTKEFIDAYERGVTENGLK